MMGQKVGLLTEGSQAEVSPARSYAPSGRRPNLRHSRRVKERGAAHHRRQPVDLEVVLCAGFESILAVPLNPYADEGHYEARFDAQRKQSIARNRAAVVAAPDQGERMRRSNHEFRNRGASQPYSNLLARKIHWLRENRYAPPGKRP
jgi:hypothetical protein